jgi:hypothetical protein
VLGRLDAIRREQWSDTEPLQQDVFDAVKDAPFGREIQEMGDWPTEQIAQR